MIQPAPAPALAHDQLGVFAQSVKVAVEARLGEVARDQTARAARASSDAREVVASLFELAQRGGKRGRPVLLAASSLACGASRESPAVIDAGVAIEILHAYLLVHDDWMDDDEMRRGGPAVHAALRERLASRSMGDACAILAGDFGQAAAFELLTQLDAPAPRVRAVVAEVSTMLGDVVMGQIIDVRGSATSREEVDTVHRLKTSSYTTRTPLALGAMLAGADGRTVQALRDAGDPLGLAFQLADDLLGVFGDPARTGKPARSDLRRGKKTALVAELEHDRDAQRLLPRVLGVADAPDEEVDALVARMVSSGAKSRVEARVRDLTAQARDGIEHLALATEGKELLLQAVDAFASGRA
jgi:geranylgeranyl diphosphate synthase, type I